MKHASSRLLTRQNSWDWTGLDSAGVYARSAYTCRAFYKNK